MGYKFSWERFEAMPVIGIMRNLPEASLEKVAALYAAAGFSTLEITMNSPNATGTIASLSKKFGDVLNIGAGTVLTLQDLDDAISAGASFIVTPVINEDVIKAAVINGIPIFPGAYTPSEIYKAWSLGASMVKVFPATRLGPEFIKEVLAPLNFLKLAPTGGVSVDNFPDFLNAGARGLGMGSSLFPSTLIASESWDALKSLFDDMIHKYHRYTGQA